MADIELVIKFPEEKYDWIMSHLKLDRNFRECKITPLPKRHGDLVDRNDLKYYKYNSYAYAIANAPTIIEADKGE